MYNSLKSLFERYEKEYAAHAKVTYPLLRQFQGVWTQDDGAILYGCGRIGRQIVDLIKASFDVKGVCDGNSARWGDEWNGFSILSPKRAASEYPKALWIICVLKAAHNFAEFQIEILSSVSSANLINMIPYYVFECGCPIDSCSLNRLHQVTYENRDELQGIYDVLADVVSKQTLYAITRKRLLLDEVIVPQRPDKYQYFDTSLWRVREDDVFVDCGAYIGDTLENLVVGHGTRWKKYHAFECTDASFRALQDFSSQIFGKNIDQVSLYPYAVGGSNGTFQMNYHNSFSWGNFVSEPDKNTESFVTCVKLDDVLENAEVTMLKMDIEGFELDALNGGRKLIERCQPILAIAGYHKAEDIWEIPKMMKKLCPEHFIFLRAYGQIFEYVFYAIPNSRLV